VKRLLSVAAVALTLVAAVSAGGDGKKEGPPLPKDSRLTPKDYEGHFPWIPPTTARAWEARRKHTRDQVLVGNGLWPMPEKTPLRAVIHGKIDRDDYTIEKVFFASYPGHYVSGNLYRPKGKGGKLPGVLCPHGHWANGRLYDAGEKAAKAQMDQGAEKTVEGARYPLQARCAQLARMGCVVFHYDMVGVADSQQIGHREGFKDPEAELRLQNFMGLQTWNSIRALDFLLSLPEVDPARIGVTGASGGGTQTFVLCAVDDRPAVAFPAVMVSTGMQGGCVCENAPFLRQNGGNIELAGLFAPKPLGMSGANDWTIDIERHGLPQLKSLYRLYGAEDNVMAKTYPQFGHNYNQVSRELMYNWFNKHLKLGQQEPVAEKPFVPVPPEELRVYDTTHPRPRDAVDVHGLRRYLAQQSEKQLQALLPKDAKSLGEFRRVLGTALRVMVNDTLPEADAVEVTGAGKRVAPREGAKQDYLLTLSRKGQEEQVDVVVLAGAETDGTVVVWVHPNGIASLEQDGKLAFAAQELLKKKATILAVQPLLTGRNSAEAEMPITKHQKSTGYAGYTTCYNRPLLSNRVHDILTAVAYARGPMKAKRVHLLGLERAGPWVVLARALCGDKVERTAADLDQFRFERILSNADEMMLPGALKYGGLPALSALCAPGELFLHNTTGTGTDRWLRSAYSAADASGRLRREADRQAPEAVIGWLVR
jgi:dienelactone hydrolase